MNTELHCIILTLALESEKSKKSLNCFYDIKTTLLQYINLSLFVEFSNKAQLT